MLHLPHFEPRFDRRHYALGTLPNETQHRSTNARRPGASLCRAGKREVFVLRTVAFVPQRGHHLVIAEQDSDLAASLSGLALQLEQQAQRDRGAATAVEKIPHLNQLVTLARPL